jgi:uncharacterized membrane protein HdeD (DUF308 family)
METAQWTVAAFQRRRHDTWKAIRVWLLLLALGTVGFFVPFWLDRSAVHTIQPGSGAVRWSLSADDITQGQFTVLLASLIVCGVAIIAIVMGLRRHYRCPGCNAIPMGAWNILGPGSVGRRSGVAVFPSVCPNCGAHLS